ncbi:MAG: FAD-dependent oxidoreductase [Bacteroidetes bacterium]|nr:FAD-dependent oxidoreductase [Bacteroidota bacterium]HET6245169.1 FAD-dependent oxidoreductase [Bacteroidia bacterium]
MINKNSIWKATTEKVDFPKLQKDISVDVAIVGGGITGLTCAHLLSESGKSVAVLEAREIGGGTTGFSTGNLYSTVDSRLYHISSKFDKKTSKNVVESRASAIDLIEQTIAKYSISCDFYRTPWHLFTESKEENKTIEKEYKALEKAGLSPTLSQSLLTPFKIESAVRIEGQAQFNPMKYVKALAKAISHDNCKIFENTRVLDFKAASPCVLETSLARISAKHIILASHTPKGAYAIQSAISPYREDAIAVKLKNTENYPPQGIYWGLTKNQHHSFRTYTTTENQKFLVLVGEHYKVGQTEDTRKKFEALEKFARQRFDIASIEYQWAAQSYRSADGLAYIGEIEENIFTGTGFSTDGLTYGTLAGMIISDTINGIKNPYAKMYDINRHNPLKAAKNYINENLNVMGEYMKDLPGIADVDQFKEIKQNEGKVISVEGEKIAAYRDINNKVYTLSAVCTHMKCIVNWNSAEKSWDCPCHGSRFDLNGTVIEGPAITDLLSKVIIEH